jgi:CubicO group peptidase (beta-lactamase class C family)
MIRWFRVVLGLILTLIATMSAASDPSADEVAAIFASLKSETDPGAAVLVIRDGRIAFLRGYGVTDLRTLHKIKTHHGSQPSEPYLGFARLRRPDAATPSRHAQR